ncbi:MAG: S8 family serine peptidase [Acidobacteriota bacterium]
MFRKRTIVFLIVVTLTFAPIFLFPTPYRAQVREKPDKKIGIIVKLARGQDIKPIIEKYSLQKISEIQSDEGNFLLVSAKNNNYEELIMTMPREIGVLSVERNVILASPMSALRQPQNFPGDEANVLGLDATAYQSQPLISFLQLSNVYSMCKGSGVKVAVIDTGIDPFHPVITGHIAAGGFDFVDFDSVPYDEPGGISYGHGTFIAGLILLVAPEVRILPLRVLAPNGVGDAFGVAAAIFYAATQGAKVINLSLGTDEKPTIVRAAISYAQSRGCVIVAAAGNSNSGHGNVFPANEACVLGIGATDFADKKAKFSNYGAAVDLTAPGVDLISTYPGGFYARWSGTSFSTPLVAGEAALLFSEYSNGEANVVEIMTKSSVKLNDNSLKGKGRISPLAALLN